MMVAKEWQPGNDEGGRGDRGDEGGRGDKGDKGGRGDEGGRGDREKPRGGMHTGGGALATTGNGLAAGSLLLLGGVGVGAYKLRRRQATGGAMA